MRIQLDPSSSALSGTNAVGPAAVAKGTSGGAFREAGASGDSASLSGISSLLGQVSADRSVRLASLTAAVQSGSYDVPSAAISRAILDEAAA